MRAGESVDYDAISCVYDVSRGTNLETVEKLIRLLRVDSDSVLLDVGCGTGNYTAALRQVAGGIIGMDVSANMLQQARAKFPNLWLAQADAANLPFNEESFGGISVIQVLHHVAEKGRFLNEAHRVLRKAGRITIHSCSHDQMRAVWFYHYFPRGLEVDLARIPDSGQIASLLEDAGFSNVGVEICYHDSVVADETPESYLDKSYRDGISTFALLTKEDIQTGCEKLRRDIASGTVQAIVRQSDAKAANDVGGSCIVYGQKID